MECPDADGRTPLIAAAAKGNRACVEIVSWLFALHLLSREADNCETRCNLSLSVQLLRNNANVHAVRRPEGTTALHEAVQYCNDTQVSEMLMQYGANPFVEDARYVPLPLLGPPKRQPSCSVTLLALDVQGTNGGRYGDQSGSHKLAA